jgi:hypothetical protein
MVSILSIVRRVILFLLALVLSLATGVAFYGLAGFVNRLVAGNGSRPCFAVG